MISQKRKKAVCLEKSILSKGESTLPGNKERGWWNLTRKKGDTMTVKEGYLRGRCSGIKSSLERVNSWRTQKDDLLPHRKKERYTS